MLSLDRVTAFNDFLLLKEDWNTLLSKSSYDSVFLRHEWFSAWWQAFGDQKELFVLLIKENGSLVGIAPLMLVSEKFRGLPVRCLKFIANDESPRADFIIKQNRTDILPFLLDFLEKAHNDWDLIVLKSILKKSETYQYFFEKNGKTQLIFRSKNSWASPILHPTMDWNAFLATKTKLFRKRIRRFRNKIKNLGQVEIKKINDTSSTSPEMAYLWQVGQKSWKHHIKRAISSTEPTRKFFSILTELASQQGWLNLWLLLVNNQPIAFEYQLKYNNKIHGMRSEFDEAYQSYSPGFVLDTLIVEDVFNRGNLDYDMGGNTDSYKLQWTLEVQEHKEVFVFNSHFYSRLIFVFEFVIIQKLLKLVRSITSYWKNRKTKIDLNMAVSDEDKNDE